MLIFERRGGLSCIQTLLVFAAVKHLPTRKPHRFQHLGLQLYSDQSLSHFEFGEGKLEMRPILFHRRIPDSRARPLCFGLLFSFFWPRLAIAWLANELEDAVNKVPE